jgi:hypothetical protein
LRVDSGEWFNYLTMAKAIYLELLQKIIPRIEKSDTVMRRAITPHERHSVTLLFLATGRNCKDLKFSAAISPHTLGVVNPETCRATYEELKEEHCKVLKTLLKINYQPKFKNVLILVYQ